MSGWWHNLNGGYEAVTVELQGHDPRGDNEGGITEDVAVVIYGDEITVIEGNFETMVNNFERVLRDLKEYWAEAEPDDPKDHGSLTVAERNPGLR